MGRCSTQGVRPAGNRGEPIRPPESDASGDAGERHPVTQLARRPTRLAPWLPASHSGPLDHHGLTGSSDSKLCPRIQGDGEMPLDAGARRARPEALFIGSPTTLSGRHLHRGHGPPSSATSLHPTSSVMTADLAGVLAGGVGGHSSRTPPSHPPAPCGPVLATSPSMTFPASEEPFNTAHAYGTQDEPGGGRGGYCRHRDGPGASECLNNPIREVLQICVKRL